jgi:N utilization substance protein B
MPAVDRAIARIGIAELIMRPDVDTAIVISEAVEVAGVLSTDESAHYLNGLLGAVAAVRDRLTVPD